MSLSTPARNYAPGMGSAVADRTINRKINKPVTPYMKAITVPRDDGHSLDDQVNAWCKSNGFIIDGYDVPHGDDLTVDVELNVVGIVATETWADVAKRVALGNSLLHPIKGGLDMLAGVGRRTAEYDGMHHHLRQASILMSGRHLQHGDEDQPGRPMEVFTNCGDSKTEVITLEKGVVKLGDVVGQMLTVRGSDGQWHPAKFNEHGEQQLFDLTFVGKNGRGKRFARFTRNHRWMLADGTFTDNIKVGDVLMPAPIHAERDPLGVVHGLVFGDGTAHKGRRDSGRPGVSQGRTYASIRVCKSDKVRDEIHSILDKAGYTYTTPPSAEGDRVYYIGKFAHAKDLPFTRDPDYIAGFIYGWWLADGNKTEANGTWTISTADTPAANWLTEHSIYAGLQVVSACVKARREGDGSFPNGQALNIVRLRGEVEWKLSSIEEGEVEVVYCPEESVTTTFTLANGLVTGNCSTSAASFLTFYLLLNGSGVGRAYDNAMIVQDLRNLPITVCVCDSNHNDVQSGLFNVLDQRGARHLYGQAKVEVFMVPDSREGWAKAIEKMELMAYEGVHRDTVLLLDFSGVRPKGSPINGMQGRPASGPGPLISAINNVAKLRDAGMAPWRSAIYADHYLAECVLVGGARRAARMSTKTWRDADVLDFIEVKRGGFLWSSNNSVTVDREFWDFVKLREEDAETFRHAASDLQRHACAVFDAVTEAAYFDQTGEPGLITVDMLTHSDEGTETLFDGDFAKSSRYELDTSTLELTRALAAAWQGSLYKVITNPCVTGDTWIATSEGPRQVGELVDKPFTAVVDGRPYAATGFWKTGNKPVFKVKTNRGYELRATDNHKLLVETSRKRKFQTCFNVETEWVEIKDLEPGDKLVLSNHRGATIDGMDEFDRGWLLGEIVGDGGYNPSKYPAYLRFWGEGRESMAELAAGIIGSGVQSNIASGTTQVACKALDKLAEGLITPAKTLLPALEKRSAGFIAGFLRGMFDADGCVLGDAEKGASVRLWQADERRIKTVQRMLQRLGIASTCYMQRELFGERELPDGKGGLKSYLCSAGHELVVSKDNINRFADVVGFYEQSKAARLVSILSDRKRAPYQERFTTEVVAIEPDGFEAVYDCTVQEVHRFCANGITAHNCGEICLIMLGGYCVIADVVPFHAGSKIRSFVAEQGGAAGPAIQAEKDLWDVDAEDSFRVATRALIRTNLMDSLYSKEVKRTNRIGVGMTGLHEYAFARFGYGWKDIVNESKSLDFWLTLSRFKRAVQSEAFKYATELGVTVPHTDTTMKPAGCASLDTAIKTTDGVLTMRELFAKHGIQESDLQRMQNGTWIEPAIATMVLDQDNVERTITKLYLNGVKPVYEIEFEDGVVAKLTGNHKLMTAKGWKRVDELTEFDEIIHY
jgi:intein/homing endonuclease